jgi:heat shock protein HspQ
MRESNFCVGQIVHHRLFGYRGVIYDVDADFQGTEQWYTQVAKTRPPKDQPWYHVLVDGQAGTTYVAERNLEPTDDHAPIEHPLIERLFSAFEGGLYRLRMHSN